MSSNVWNILNSGLIVVAAAAAVTVVAEARHPQTVVCNVPDFPIPAAAQEPAPRPPWDHRSTTIVDYLDLPEPPPEDVGIGAPADPCKRECARLHGEGTWVPLKLCRDICDEPARACRNDGQLWDYVNAVRECDKQRNPEIFTRWECEYSASLDHCGRWVP